MSETLRESLSAVMDSEAEEFETRRVLDEAATDDELLRLWDRFHLIRSVVGREAGRRAPDGMRERMWARIDAGEFADEIDPGVGNAGRSRWANPVTGFAVAAAVAMVVIIGYNFESSNEVVPASLVASPVKPPSIDRLTPAPTPVSGQALKGFPSRHDVQRAQAYMVRHAQHRGVSNRASVLPFVKVVAFEAE